MNEDIFAAGTLNKSVALTVPFSLTNNTPFASIQRNSLAALQPERKGCCFAGTALAATKKAWKYSQQPVRPRSSTALYKNINQKFPGI